MAETLSFYISYYGYSVLFGVSIILSICFSAWYGKYYGIRAINGGKYAVLIYSLCIVALYAWKEIDRVLTGTGSLTSSKMIFVGPVATALLSRWFAVEPLNSADYFTPTYFLARGIGKIGCLCNGCCLGREWPWGIYDPVLGGYAFPMPLFEAIGCFVVMCLALVMNKRMDYRGNGRVYAYSLIAFGVFRYCVEFTSRAEIAVWLINESQIYAGVMVLLGLFGLYLIEQIEARIHTN